MRSNPQEPTDLDTFTEEILNSFMTGDVII